MANWGISPGYVGFGCALMSPNRLQFETGTSPGTCCALIAALLLLAAGCRTPPTANEQAWEDFIPPAATPLNDRNWIVEHKVLASANMKDNQITVHNVRDAE